nr:hypothetical protein [Paraburkholderia flagellata]
MFCRPPADEGPEDRRREISGEKPQHFINIAKEQGPRPKEVNPNDDLDRKFVELYGACDQRYPRERVVDLAELLRRCHALLSRNPGKEAGGAASAMSFGDAAASG